MTQRVILGCLIACGLGIGLFAAAERAMRGAGRTVVTVDAPPAEEPETPIEIVTQPARPRPTPAAASRPAARLAPATTASPENPRAGEVARWEEPRPQPVATVAAAPAPADGVSVDRLAVCLSVKDRNPAGETAVVPADVGKVYAWMRVSGAKGRKVRTVWTVNGKSTPGSWLNIGSNSWRTWATKRVDASMKGTVKVEVQDEKGRVLAAKEFKVVSR